MSIARRPVFAARTATTTDLLHTRNGRSFSSAELSRQLGVAPFTAWSMRRKITRAVQRKEGELMLAGVVEMDEACVGGASKGKRGRGASGKTPVAVMCEQNESGGCDLVHIQVTHDISGLSLGDAATSYITPGSVLATDGLLPTSRLASVAMTISHWLPQKPKTPPSCFPGCTLLSPT